MSEIKPMCEFRLTTEEADKIIEVNANEIGMMSTPQEGLVVGIYGYSQKNTSICKIALKNPVEFDGCLACGHPCASTESCPIAQAVKKTN